MRIEVLLKFCFVFYFGFKYIDVDQVYQKGTISNKFW